MSQLTNLNVSPYFDDFDPANDYYRVLFKPGYPVQARELTGLQSMLQNQIEKFGQHFFKEGSKVIPGNTSYTSQYKAIQLENNFQGIPVAAYVDQIVGTKITGQSSGVTATVDKVLLAEDSENQNLTLYVNYLGANTSNNTGNVFSDGEELTSDVTITSGLLGNSAISIGTPFATTIANDAAAVGSSFHIENGVYFVRGQFVNVAAETLILDQYGNSPSYRIGFNITEEIITADLDEELNDNSQGFNNYSAPGADRLKITLKLFKKTLDDLEDESFVELATVEEGSLRSKVNTTEYNNLADELARRTYAESGDYYVKAFDISVLNSLNDNTGNNGVFQEGQFTYGGQTPSDDLAQYQLSPGKAFVRGYEVETIAPTYLDADKPRTTTTSEDQAIQYNTGPTFSVNGVYGFPTIGIGNTYVVSLRDQRTGTPQTASVPGKEIGQARVYDFALESGSYDTNNEALNEWDISLYDVQTSVDLNINAAPSPTDGTNGTWSAGTFIEGKNSGASGFLRYAVSAGVALTVTETSGNFIKNESLIFNGIQNGRVAISVTEYGISNIKSLWATNNGVTGVNTFCADVIQSTKFNVGVATISPVSGAGSISTIRSTNQQFPGTGELVKINDLVQWSDISTADDVPTMARVTGVGLTTIEVTGISDVNGVINGTLPSTALDVSDLKIVTTDLQSSSDNSLFTKLPKTNISDVDLTDASLSIRKVYSTETIANNRIANQLTLGTNETFLPFDAERYAVVGSGGSTITLNSDNLEFNSGMTTLDILGLNVTTDSDPVTVVTSVKKLKPTAKTKIKKRVNSLIVDNSKLVGSGIGTTTLQNGLNYGNFPYGTRVEDKTISLNVPDIIKVHGVYESSTASGNPSAPSMDLSSINSSSTTTTELIIGEQLIGQTSNAIAIVAEKSDSDTITYIYQNKNLFKEGETVIFQESNVQAVVTTLSDDSFDISSHYTFDNGQEDTFYNYGVIKRKTDSDSPAKKIKIYFENAYYDSSDDGDITTINSYNTFNYTTEIQKVGDVSNSDIIDIRPRVSDYTVSVGSNSPLTFAGRTFTQAGQTASNILASDESIVIDFSYYLGRIDRVFLTKEGDFQVVYGTPSENPQKPLPIDEALEVAVITLPPYLYNVSQATINFLDYKRYRMSDIQKLETRIRNLEYYTTLSLLEVNTANFFIPDGDGLNRFKSGFFVDNFETFKAQDTTKILKNSIDQKNRELRPSHYTNSVDMMFGPVVNVDSTEDQSNNTITGTNIRRNGDIITLDYSEEEYLKQTFGSRTESITPFIVAYWNGVITLNPESDTWVNTVRLIPRIVEREGDFAATWASLTATQGFDPQTGLGPTLWNSWQTVWTGSTTSRTLSSRNFDRERDVGAWDRVQETVFQEQRQTIESARRERTGTRQLIVSDWTERESQGDTRISRNLLPLLRSRNVEFKVEQLQKSTRMYAFFDGRDVTPYCIPKLLEISMTSGTFQVGETVEGVVQNAGLGPNNGSSNASITFRVAQSNHKEGDYNAPTKVYGKNPYTLVSLQNTYSATSTILNVDTFSLASQTQGEFNGFISDGMVLTGRSSGAQATITNVRFITDLSGYVAGSYWIPNPEIDVFPKFTAGEKLFKLSSDDQNSPVATSLAEEIYTAQGFLDTVQETILATRNARLVQQNTSETQQNFAERTTGTEWVTTNVRQNRRWQNRNIGGGDPLAQSFKVNESTGVFVTKCDVFFEAKDNTDIPVIFSLRTMSNGVPTENIIPLTEVALTPEAVNVSTDGSVATTFEFGGPVYLEGGMEYAIVMLSNSAKYRGFISRVGEDDLISGAYIANQPTLGSLFKSQNASTWEPSQWEDLKYTLYRAEFVETGTLSLYSPELTEGNKQIPLLQADPIVLTSKQIRVGLGTTLTDSGYVMGNTFYQQGTNATGDLVGVAGTATGALNIINAGIGYTPISGGYTFTGVVLDTITGNGRGATADIAISNGVAVGATISGVGTGYQVGDVLGITTIGVSSIGRNFRASVVSIGSTNELLLNNVQGTFVVGTSNTVFYYKNSAAVGVATELNFTRGGDVQINRITTDTDGLHLKVNHKNHGMYFTKNNVKISDAQSDVKPTKLTTAYDVGTTTGSISVDSASNFTSFENVGVGTTNYGYLQIGNEIISYESVTGNSIGITTRALDNTSSKTYPIGTPVFKYELGGVNLLRINKTHGLSTTTSAYPNATSLDTSGAITFDSYNVKLDMSKNGTDRSSDNGNPALYINQSKSAGGYGVRATQNMPFELITPLIQNMTVPTTTLSAEVVTTTAKSISGNEIPYVEHDAESITLNSTNYLDSPRIVASKINEDTFLTNVEGSKSMNMTLFLNTTNTTVSPVIDGQRKSVILTSNRVNDIITNYATDDRVNTVDTDPTAFQYISKEMLLENSATSLKVFVGAHLHVNADLRVLYAINNKEGLDPIFTPFPGYSNLNYKGQVINPADNNGLPDKLITKSNSSGFDSEDVEFKEYTFTVDQLPSFRSYRIKILMTSESQVYVPRLKDLRAIALA